MLIPRLLKENIFPGNLPLKYFLVVTKSCNSRCKNCSIWKEEVSQEMTVSEYEYLARNSRDNLVWLNISGGEPTNRKDLSEIINIFVDHCPNLQIINFTTNGMNLENLEEVCRYLSKVQVPLLSINVSIDGPREIHNYLRGINGFDTAIEAFKIVRSFKKIRTYAAMTLYPKNQKLIFETAEAIAEFIPDFNFDNLHLNFPHRSDHFYGNTSLSYDEQIDIAHAQPFFKNRFSSLSPMNTIEAIYQDKLKEFIRTKKTPVSCASMASNVYISEKGDVYPCTIWDKKIGSLRESNYDLKEIWESEKRKLMRAEIISKKCPNCWTPCEAFPSLLTNLRQL